MSVITNLLVVTIEREGSKPITALNAWCDAHAAGQHFRPVDIDPLGAPDDLEPLEEEATLATAGALPPRRRSGGSKVFTARVYACAGNYFPNTELLAAFPSFGWDSYSAEVSILIYRHEDNECWRGVHATGRPIYPTAEQEHAALGRRAEALRNINVLREALNDETALRAMVRWLYEHPSERDKLYKMLGVQ